MSEPVWKLLPRQHDTFIDVVFREWPDGRQESCLVTAEEYLKWLEEGNEPLPLDGASAAEPVAEPVAEPLPPDEVPE